MAPSRAPPISALPTSPSPPPTEEDDDPVTAEYDIYITPRTLASLYLLQFPTRDREQPYNAEFANAPSEMRIKPDSGFLEMDVPINPELYYDREKAAAWGAALAKSKSEGAQGHGLAAGFAHVAGLRSTGASGGGAAAGGQGRGRGGGRQQQQQMEVEDDESRNEQHKMRIQTLGGQIVRDEKGRPNYMIGAFRGTELHLTPITGLIQMRPQFHHIDAKTQQDRTRARRDREAANSADPSSSTTAPAQPRIVQLVNKTGGDGNDDSSGGGMGGADSTKEYLNKAMEEQWTRLRFFDEEEDKAYEAYHACLFHNETDRAKRLVAGMGNEAFVDAISAPRLDPSGKRVVRPLFRRGKGKGKGSRKVKRGLSVGGEGERLEGGVGDTAEEDEHEDDDDDEEEEEEEEEEDDAAAAADARMDVDEAET